GDLCGKRSGEARDGRAGMDDAGRIHGKLQLRLSVSLRLYEPAGPGNLRSLHRRAGVSDRCRQLGDTNLDGLKFAVVIRSGKVMADGNWVFAGVVDERADDAQRRALAAIVGGEAGGPPGFIRQNLVSDFRGVEFRPIDFNLEGLRRSTAIPGILSFEIEGVASRNRSGEPFYIDNTAHPAGRRLALARAKEMHLHGFGLDLDLAGKGNNGH